jgi:hypothetical protein
MTLPKEEWYFKVTSSLTLSSRRREQTPLSLRRGAGGEGAGPK